MARRHRPSIPLIILFVILLLLFIFAGTLFSLALDFTGQGHIEFNYRQGSSQIVSITHQLPQELADAMDPKPVTGWTVNLANDALTLTGGSLSPGQSVTVDYKLTKYITGGTKQITTISRTADGQENTSQFSLEVDTTALGFMWALYQNAIWFLILAIIVIVVIVLLYIKGQKKDEEMKKE
jgi:preprotein translocase subunit SecF